MNELKGRKLSIRLVKGSDAPRYNNGETELFVSEAVITENGMKSGLPVVDIVMQDESGKVFYFMLSGRLVQNLAAAIDGVNSRNHGV